MWGRGLGNCPVRGLGEGMEKKMSRVDYAYHMPRASIKDATLHIKNLTMESRDARYGTQQFDAYEIDDEWLRVPRFYGIQHFGPADEDCTTDGDALSHLTFCGTLTNIQELALKSLEDVPHSPHGGILCLPCGFGKTVAALAYICRLRRRALVLVTKTFLADQWRAAVQRTANATAGRIRRHSRHGDITISTVQSIISREYDLACFGLVVVDEAHHMAAAAFSRALWKISARNVLGLTATPERSDGLTNLLFYSMGEIAFRCSRDAKTERVAVEQWVYDRSK